MAEDLTIATLRALRRILRASELGNRHFALATGLTPSQLLVLREIGERGETTPSELAAALHFGQATITTIVDRLESLVLVTRRRGEQDKRRIHLGITPAGAQAVEQAPDLLQARFSEGFAVLPAWQQAMILASLERLGEIFGVASSDAAPLLDAGAIDRDRAS
jgi:DNA-binding MarR family transcriptional regulator